MLETIQYRIVSKLYLTNMTKAIHTIVITMPIHLISAVYCYLLLGQRNHCAREIMDRLCLS